MLEIQVEEIRKKHFQTGEIKSNKVATNYKRRIQVLNELCALNFQIYAVVVDKKRLYSEGFRHKASFYKFMNGLLYQELYKTLPNLSLVVDEHGGNDYMLSFKKYVHKTHVSDLFDGAEFSLDDSKGQKLIQVADFFAGTLGYCFDESKKGEHSDKFLEIIKPHLSGISHYPSYEVSLQANDDSEVHFDSRIAETSLSAALNFVKKKRISDQTDKDQVNLVRLLMLYQSSYKGRSFISTKELINHLQAGRDKEISEQYFRTKIIAKVRDAGVLIASNSSGARKGYKLPSSANDLYKFINHSNSVVIPMLKRVKSVMEIIKLATGNELDLLAKPEYAKMQSIISKL